jgi:hypothetical protein
VELFRDLELKWNGIDLDGLDPREAKKILGAERLGPECFVGSEADIEQEFSNGRPARDAETRNR